MCKAGERRWEPERAQSLAHAPEFAGDSPRRLGAEEGGAVVTDAIVPVEHLVHDGEALKAIDSLAQ